jgi:hypothetical protein
MVDHLLSKTFPVTPFLAHFIMPLSPWKGKIFAYGSKIKGKQCPGGKFWHTGEGKSIIFFPKKEWLRRGRGVGNGFRNSSETDKDNNYYFFWNYWKHLDQINRRSRMAFGDDKNNCTIRLHSYNIFYFKN